jgi:hypothetical protein
MIPGAVLNDDCLAPLLDLVRFPDVLAYQDEADGKQVIIRMVTNV